MATGWFPCAMGKPFSKARNVYGLRGKTMQSPILLLEIEEKLQADESGAFRQSLVDRLLALQASLYEKRRTPQDRDTYRDIQAAIQAVDGALLTLRTTVKRRK